MKKLLRNMILFSGVNLLLMWVVAFAFSRYVQRNTFQNTNTESNLLFLSKGAHTDCVLLGLSHARNFSRHQNHERVERILGKKIVNLGQGNGRGGVLNQYLHLRSFYERGNTAGEVVYFLTPVMLYEHYLDIAPMVYEHEPLSTSFFLYNAVEGSENRLEQLFYYVRTKYSLSWRRTIPVSKPAITEFLTQIDTAVVNAGLKTAYAETFSNKTFALDSAIVERTISLAHSKGSRVLFIIPPALFGQWPEHEGTLKLVQTLSDRYGCRYADLSGSITDPGLYYDHHHLNTRGVETFTREHWLLLEQAINRSDSL